MIYIKLSQYQKTLAIAKRYCVAPIALTLFGVSSMVLPGNTQSAIPEGSTATLAQLPASRFSIPGQVITKSLLNTRHIEAQPSRNFPRVKIAQNTDDSGNSGRPDGSTRRSGGTRGGGCPHRGQPLTALVPITQSTSSEAQSLTLEKTSSQTVLGVTFTALGLTVAEHPTFWFFVPYQLTSAYSIEFILQDENGKDVYQTKFTESGVEPGIVGFQLPPTAPSLVVNKMYNWFFLIHCNSIEPDHVAGWVRRVELNPSLQTQLQQATPQQSVALYTKSGIWYEAVTALAEQLRKNPEDATLKEQWTKLLQSVNLEAIAQKPITSVIIPKK